MVDLLFGFNMDYSEFLLINVTNRNFYKKTKDSLNIERFSIV